MSNQLKTFKDKEINKVGASVVKYLEQFKMGQKDMVVFKMLNGVKNTDEKGKDKQPIIYPNITISTHFWINTEEGAVEIGAVDLVKPDGNLRFSKLHVDGSSTAGKIRLFGNNIKHQMLLPILMLSPENQASPYKDSNITPIFTIVDAKAEANKKAIGFTALSRALKMIENLKDEDLKEFNMAFGGGYEDEKIEMTTRLQEAAVNDAEDFLSKVNKPETKLNSIIKIAIQKNHIQYDPMLHRYFWVKNQQSIATFDRVEGKDELELLIDFLQNAKAGPATLKAIEELNNPTDKPNVNKK